MGMTVKFNVEALEASIRNTAKRAGDNASRTMRRAAIRIRDLAVAYAPRDTGTLENAIDYGVTRDGRRNMYVVYIDLSASQDNGKSLSEYAWIMEQQLHPFGRQAPGAKYFKVRAKSKAKGPKVGGHFIQRAIKEGTKDMLSDVRTEISRTLGNRLVHLDMGQ